MANRVDSGYKFKVDADPVEYRAADIQLRPPRKRLTTRQRQLVGRWTGGLLIYFACNALIYVLCCHVDQQWGWDGQQSTQVPAHFNWWQPVAILVLSLLGLIAAGITILVRYTD